MRGLHLGPDGSTLPRATARLHFRWWRTDDLELARVLWGDPQVTRLIDARGALTAAQVRDRLHAEIATADAHGVQYWPIFDHKNEGHIGCAGLRPYDLERAIYEVGTQLCAAHWGRGLATEAARSVLAHAFDHLHAQAVFAGHNPANHASRHLLGKLGFRYTHDELYPPTGLMHPSYLMTAAEYQQHRSDAQTPTTS